MVGGHKFPSIKPETFRPVQKTPFLHAPLAFGAPLGDIPSEFRRYLLHHKTRLIALLYGVVFVILRPAVLV